METKAKLHKGALWMLLPLVIILTISCSSTIPGGLSDSDKPVTPGQYTVQSTVEGEDSGISVFGISFTKPSLQSAIEDAHSKVPSDALINIHWYVETTSWVILPVVTQKYIVKAVAVRTIEGGRER
ncbi:MAG: hypothetical protein P9M15_00945 [Candidatus Electryoneaceae bacterium]|nr:hypothetical protein [Candidatus Electryoneaceae bacterium]